jgi:hypothetical protein
VESGSRPPLFRYGGCPLKESLIQKTKNVVEQAPRKKVDKELPKLKISQDRLLPLKKYVIKKDTNENSIRATSVSD